MKQLLLLLGLVIINSAVAQKSVHLPIAGISPEAEKATIAGDRIGFFEYDKGGFSKNIIVAATTEKGKKRFFESFDVRPDENGHYDFSKIIMVKESSKFTFDGEIKLLIYMPTIFGNAYWTEITRTADNIGDPIVLDRYTEREGKDFEARKRLSINFASIAYDNNLKAKVKDNGDSWEDRERSDFRLMLKNEDDSNWKINEIVSKGSLTNGRQVEAKIEYSDELNLEKNIVVRGEVTTRKGNILWHEETVEARELTKVFFASNYKIVEQSEAVTEEVTSNEETEEEELLVEEIPEQESSNEELPTGPEASLPGIGAATDLTTKTTLAKCPVKAVGDTLVTINGSQVCVREVKSSGSKAHKGKLSMDVNIEIDGTLFPLSGNQPIEFKKGESSLQEGTLRANVTYTNEVGTFELKSGTKVIFRNNKLISASLASSTKIKTEDISFECGPNPSLEQDIRFDVNGRLIECTVVDELSWGTEPTLKFPGGSRLVFKSGKLFKVFSVWPSFFELNEVNYQVKGDPNVNAYEFSAAGRLEEINADHYNTVLIEGQKVPVEAGTKMKFEFVDGAYYLQKFFVGEDVTVNVYKKNKSKEETVKKGKKIVLEKGIVVKAG
jgi:hypothetical protein